MKLIDNHPHVIALCRRIAEHRPEANANDWREYYADTLKLYALLSRSPFIIDALGAMAYPHTLAEADPTRPAPHSLEWDQLTDPEARNCAQVLRCLALTACTPQQIAESCDLMLDEVGAAEVLLMSTGYAARVQNRQGSLEVTPLGITAARYFAQYRNEIRPPEWARHDNRRRPE